MTEKNTEKIRPFLGRIPRPNAVQEMIRESEREIEYLRVMLKASREMENIESTPKPEVSPKPERRELRLVRSRGYWRQWDYRHDDCMDRVETMEVREVLPGDPAPEAIEEVAKRLDSDDRSYLHELAAKLRGETDE